MNGESAKFWCERSTEEQATTTATNQSFRLRLHSGLRQSGDAFGVAFYGTAEAVPFRRAEFSAPSSARALSKAIGAVLSVASLLWQLLHFKDDFGSDVGTLP
jgi:hypothetical protein